MHITSGTKFRRFLSAAVYNFGDSAMKIKPALYIDSTNDFFIFVMVCITLKVKAVKGINAVRGCRRGAYRAERRSA